MQKENVHGDRVVVRGWLWSVVVAGGGRGLVFVWLWLRENARGREREYVIARAKWEIDDMDEPHQWRGGELIVDENFEIFSRELVLEAVLMCNGSCLFKQKLILLPDNGKSGRDRRRSKHPMYSNLAYLVGLLHSLSSNNPNNTGIHCENFEKLQCLTMLRLLAPIASKDTNNPRYSYHSYLRI